MSAMFTLRWQYRALSSQSSIRART